MANEKLKISCNCLSLANKSPVMSRGIPSRNCCRAQRRQTASPATVCAGVFGKAMTHSLITGGALLFPSLESNNEVTNTFTKNDRNAKPSGGEAQNLLCIEKCTIHNPQRLGSCNGFPQGYTGRQQHYLLEGTAAPSPSPRLQLSFLLIFLLNVIIHF